MSLSPAQQQRNRLASLSRRRPADHPEIIDARRDLATEKLAAYAERVCADAPPLEPAQIDRIVAALRTAGGAR